MSSRNYKYRNPPLPLGYVKKTPQLVPKKSSDVEVLDIDRLIDLVILSGICDVPDPSVYDHFTINSCSEDDDITEVPVKICPKKIEVLLIEDEDVSPESKEDIKVITKVWENQSDSPKLHTTTETSEDIEQGFKVSTSPKHMANLLKTDLGTDKNDKIVEDKKPKKHDRGHKSSYHSKKINKRKDNCSNYDTDNSSYINKMKHMKKEYESGSDSHSRSRHKRRESYENDSESHPRSRHKRTESCESDSESHPRSRHKRTESCESDSDSHSRGKHKRDDIHSKSSERKKLPKRYTKKNYDSDNSSHRIKPKREYSSDDSESSGVRMVRRRRNYSSEQCYNEEYEKSVRYTEEETEPGLLFGQYPCEICNINLNSYATYQSHINGKRHMKALNSQTATVKPLVLGEADSRCPKPLPEYYRKKMNFPAHIQPVLDQNLRNPCPGLENVTEIHTITETIYYCSFCNSSCGNSSILPHLNGFKHQINCLKHYRNDLYKKWNYVPKYQIENRVAYELRSIELKIGRGQVKVEKDFRITDSNKDEFEAASRRDPSKPSTSAQAAEMDYTNYMNHSEPDPSKPGYYCRLCDSHSNSEGMWKNHILGKRHSANLRKTPGSAPTKSKYIPAPDKVPYLLDLLKRENPDNAPAVGLDQIREIRKPDIGGVSYNCFLCNAFISSFEIVDHILSRKHREKYLTSIKHPRFETLKSLHMSDSRNDSIIEEICGNVQNEIGLGDTEVYYAKNAVLRG